ncbi:MAG: helix-turn-helix domain-containing protein [Myxococcales bacterium]|nr:helix-turn-helix domain-containing protein [Myxococcales bacterium]
MFVERAKAPDRNMAALCREYGITRETGYKWLARFEAEGYDGLDERSRRPESTPLSSPKNGGNVTRNARRRAKRVRRRPQGCTPRAKGALKRSLSTSIEKSPTSASRPAASQRTARMPDTSTTYTVPFSAPFFISTGPLGSSTFLVAAIFVPSVRGAAAVGE